MKKKKIITIIIVLLLVVLLFPVRLQLKDGGSIQYKSLTYSITKVHSLVAIEEGTVSGGQVKPYQRGIRIEILGMKVYDSVDNAESENDERKSISCDDEAEETTDMIPMVMVNGELYLTTGYESAVTGRCGVMDGEITSTVNGSEKPTKDNQSNFGTGYGYQYGAKEGTIEIYMDGKWWIYATEEVRQQMQFSDGDS